ncbi:MAG: tyrosine phenol-lyase, partial [Acidobacteriota bacterium]|nr:tyrosine phenol-lyase [Acidobacteriota bacterium]
TGLGIPIVRPPGGHAVYIDAGAMLPHIPPGELPGQALACAFYLAGGVRGAEIGTLMFGDHAALELLRLAIPRRVYTQSQIDYVIDVAAEVAKDKAALRGLRIVEQAEHLRHFSAKLEPLA